MAIATVIIDSVIVVTIAKPGIVSTIVGGQDYYASRERTYSSVTQ